MSGGADGPGEVRGKQSVSWSTVLAWPLIAVVRVYQLVISPMSPPSCRFYPSCSAYAVTALTRFGPLKGSWLAVRRLARCHPWNPGGVDHVPEREHLPPSGQSRPQSPTRMLSLDKDPRVRLLR